MRPAFFAAALVLASMFLGAPRAHAAQDYLRELQARAKALHLAQSRPWLDLLHYGWTLTGFHSLASQGPFFLSPKGRRDPQAEMDADLAAFFQEEPNPDDDASCRFPARYTWLNSALGFNPDQIAPSSCPLLEHWKAMLSAQTISVVFASAYMDNPSSMYGHTFLLIHHAGRAEDNGLLDYAINYAARANTDNGALFAVYGLLGLFPGRFSTMPYYLKVQEYSNLESRDLWEYQLDLPPAAIDELINHIWEMNQASFPYYFFNRNCSYQLLPLLDAAAPELRLAHGWPPYIIPADTVRLIESRHGLVARLSYRPSQVSRMIFDRGRLNHQERVLAEDVARNDSGWKRLAALPTSDQAATLSASSEYLEYLIDYRKNADPAILERQHRIYLALAKTGITVPEPAMTPPAPPESGHLSGRLSLGYGFLNGRGFEDFAVRPGLHNPLDAPHGYVPWSALEMFSLDLRRDNDSGRTYLDSLTLAHILSLAPLDPWIKKPSWEVDMGLRQASELGKAPWASQYFGLTVGSGPALKIPDLPALIYALGEVDGGGGTTFQNGYRLGPGATGGLLMSAASRWRLSVDASYWRYILGDVRGEVCLRAQAAFDISNNWSIQLDAERHGLAHEARAVLIRYF